MSKVNQELNCIKNESIEFHSRAKCAKHNLKITHLYTGKQSEMQKLYCSSCSKKSNQLNIIDIPMAVKKIEEYSERWLLIIETSKMWLESFKSKAKHIVENYEKQIKLVNALQEEIQNCLLKEENEIRELLQNQTILDNQKLEKLTHLISNDLQINIQENLNSIWEKTLDQIVRGHKEQEQKIVDLTQKIQSFKSLVSTQIEQMESTLQIEDIDLLEYAQFQSIEMVVTTSGNTVTVRQLIDSQFKIKQIVKTDHKEITAIALEQNQNKMYIAGSEQNMSIWSWKPQISQFQIEKSFTLNNIIFKIILDIMSLKMITLSKKQIIVWDLIGCSPYQSLTENMQIENSQKHILSADISYSKDFFIISISGYLILLEKRNVWKILDKFISQKYDYVSVQFLNNFQILALGSQGEITLFEIKDNKIDEANSTPICTGLTDGSLRCWRNSKKIICFNQSVYYVIEIQKQKTFQLLLKQKGYKLKLTTSSTGDQFVLINGRCLTLWYITNQINSSTKNLQN